MKKEYNEQLEWRARSFIEEYDHHREPGELLSDHSTFEDFLWEDWDAGWYGFLREELFDDFNSELTTCAKIIELSDNTETDSGLWDGQEPKKAIEAQAYYSAMNDFREIVREMEEELLDEEELLNEIEDE